MQDIYSMAMLNYNAVAIALGNAFKDKDSSIIEFPTFEECFGNNNNEKKEEKEKKEEEIENNYLSMFKDQLLNRKDYLDKIYGD